MNNSIAPGSSADVNVKVTALTTNPNVPVTYKTIILKKNLVNGVNTLTQEMISIKNIKYVIKYDYVLGENITIPENCILEFDGGSFSNGILDLNHCNIVGKGLKCEIKNIPNIGLPLSSFLCDISDKNLNTKVFNALVNESIPILVDYHIIYFSGEIIANNNTPVLIETIGLNNANLFFTENSNQRGIVFKGNSRTSFINKINLYANGNVIDFSEGGAIYRSKFSNMEVTSNNGHCFYAGDNSSNGGSMVFDITFEKVHVMAPNGNGFYGINGNTIKFIAVSSANIGDSLFYNCQGVFIGCNNQYYKTTGITFFKARRLNSGKLGRLISVFINCNFEDYNGALFDCENFGYIHLEFHECTFYPHKDSESGKIKESPLKLSGLQQLVMLNCRGLSSNLYEEGVGMIYVPSLFTNIGPTIINYIGNQDITLCDAKGNFRTISSIINRKFESSIMVKDTEYKEYTLFDNIKTNYLFIKKLLYNNIDTITINNTSNNYSSALTPLGIIPQGIINLLCNNDLDDYIVTITYWNIILNNKIPNQPFRLILNNNNKKCPIIFKNIIGVSSVLYGFNSINGQNFTLNPGCSMEVLIMPPSYLNKSYGIAFMLNDFSLNIISKGTTAQRPTVTSTENGFEYYDSTLKKKILWDGTNWIDFSGNNADIINTGTFEQKPNNPLKGFAYFCTDKQTTEGSTNGIMIYHKGNNIWIDALGRVIS